MASPFRLWRRLAQTIVLVTAAAALSACGEDPLAPATDPGDGTTDPAVEADQEAPRAGYYAAPGGSSAGDGSYRKPWDLATALAGGGGRVSPGDTIWLRGGTYRGPFRSTVRGVPGKPVVVRGLPGERAIIDAAGSLESTWHVGGEYSVFWGFEITNSAPDRMLSGSGRRGNVIANYASHTTYVNLVVHDGGVAFYNESDYSHVEIAGCIIYNSGWQRGDRGHGHAIYLRSNTGPVTARDNILFNQFGYGVHVFTNPGEGRLDNIRLEGNVAFNNGTLSSNSTAANILFGGDGSSTGGVLRDNLTYVSPGVGGDNVHVGWGTLQNGSVRLVNNYVAGGATALEVGYWSSLTATGNRIMGTGAVVQLHDPAMSLGEFSGQTASTLPTETRVVVRGNPYERGRAHIVVYNWGRHGAVAVDLAGIVPTGARYEVRNVQQLFGAPVVAGTFRGGPITLPIVGVRPPVPTGMSRSRAPATGIAFNAYVVTIRP
ncbi:MAG: hypothetical protein ACREMN_12340 [Gemmatimonadales bacterium]